MDAMKFRVNSPEHSEQIQKKLFEMGYKWSIDGQTFQNTDANYLWAGSFGNNCITYGYGDEDYFNKHCYSEYILTPQGTFAKVEDYYKQPETKQTPSGLTISGTLYTDKHTYNWNLGDKPPLGLKPKKIHDQHRLLEIIDAMSRYASTGNVIPAEWFAEAQYLNGQMEGK